jgi:hypothetical protein
MLNLCPMVLSCFTSHMPHDWSMGQTKYSVLFQWVCCNGLWDKTNVFNVCSMVLPGPTSYRPHGCVVLDHGTDQMFNLCPMVLTGSTTHLPHGCVSLVCGTDQMFDLWPMVLPGSTSYMFMGVLHRSMGQNKCLTTVAQAAVQLLSPVPWVCST